MRLRAVLLVALPVAALTAGVTHAATVIPHLEAAVAPLDQFTPITPVRLLDTRTGLGADAPGRVQPGQIVSVITHAPAGTQAVAVNVKLVDPVGDGFITVWDGQPPMPVASLMDGNGLKTINNSTTTLIDQRCGCFRVFVSERLSTDLVVDMVGFWSRTPEFAVGPPPVP